MSQLHFEKMMHADCIHYKDGPLARSFCWGQRPVWLRRPVTTLPPPHYALSCHPNDPPRAHTPFPCVPGRCGGFNHRFGCGEAGHAIGDCPYTKKAAHVKKQKLLKAIKASA